MIQFSYPAWTESLRNFYWQLRACRAYDQAGRRKFYRRIRVERDRLVSSGINEELVRLLCRHLSDPTMKIRAIRLAEFERKMCEQRFNLARPALLQVGLANEAARTRVA